MRCPMKILANGLQYHVHCEGKGIPLLFLHGFMGGYTRWLKLFEPFREQLQLIFVDLPGHGETDVPLEEERYHLFKACDDLIAILNALNIEKPNILGYSMGGRLALAYAIRYPQRYQRLFLESASPGIDDVLARARRLEDDRGLANKLLNGLPIFIEEWNRQEIFQSLEELPPELLAIRRMDQQRHSATGLAMALAGMSQGAQPSLWNKLTTLQQKIYLMAGEKDRKYCKINQLMHALCPNSELKLFNNVGHLLHYEAGLDYQRFILERLMD
jgi:2-succinyl-6-hydroxy-2,4-cyclohexadiene-1-carboxylate synthase